MKCEVKNISTVNFTGDTVDVTVVLDRFYKDDVYNLLNEMVLSDKPYILTIEKQKRARSLNANAYCWTLCDKIAAKVGATKEAVYRKNVSEVGLFDVVAVDAEAMPRWIKNWSGKGIGWQCEVLGESDEGRYNVINYYGSSVYDTKEMARLIDALIQEAKSLGIETLPPEEVERLKTAWKG